MNTKKQTQTAEARNIKSAAHAAEKARLYAAASRTHADRAENNLTETTLYSDKAREAATRSKAYSSTACSHANRADDNAKRAELNAKDAATYAAATRICLLLTFIFNAIFAFIFYTLH